MWANSFFLIPSVAGICWAIAILPGGNRNFPSRNMGGIALLFIGIGFLASFAGANTPDVLFSYLSDIVNQFCVLTFFSFMTLYFRALTNERSLRWSNYLILLPAFLLACSCLFLLWGIHVRTGGNFRLDVVWPFKPGYIYPDWLFQTYTILHQFVYKILVVIQVNYLLIYGWISLNRDKEQLEDFFHQPGIKAAQHNQALFRGLSLSYLLMFFILGSDYILTLKYDWLLHVELLLWAGMLYYAGYHISKTYNVADSITAHTNHTRLVSLLEEIMNEEQYFLRQNIRLESLARRMNSNRTYISRLFKEEYNCGFTEYINHKRVEYAQELMRREPGLTQEQLSEKSGFSHISSFSRAFKQYTGMTFREWNKKRNS